MTHLNKVKINQNDKAKLYFHLHEKWKAKIPHWILAFCI